MNNELNAAQNENIKDNFENIKEVTRVGSAERRDLHEFSVNV